MHWIQSEYRLPGFLEGKISNLRRWDRLWARDRVRENKTRKNCATKKKSWWDEKESIGERRGNQEGFVVFDCAYYWRGWQHNKVLIGEQIVWCSSYITVEWLITQFVSLTQTHTDLDTHRQTHTQTVLCCLSSFRLTHKALNQKQQFHKCVEMIVEQNFKKQDTQLNTISNYLSCRDARTDSSSCCQGATVSCHYLFTGHMHKSAW